MARSSHPSVLETDWYLTVDNARPDLGCMVVHHIEVGTLEDARALREQVNDYLRPLRHKRGTPDIVVHLNPVREERVIELMCTWVKCLHVVHPAAEVVVAVDGGVLREHLTAAGNCAADEAVI